MKKLFSIVLIVLILCSAALCLIACDNTSIDYSKDNYYEFEVTEDDDAVTYMPKGVTAKYGLLFYLGTFIAPEGYSYLAESLAKQGYAVVISKIALAYFLYKETEVAFEKYPNIEFFIGGHSQGGGAAIKRAQENPNSIKGVILYAPLCNGKETIEDTSIPTLLLEATKDNVLNNSQKETARGRLPENRTEYMLEGCHMCFSSFDDDALLAPFNDGPVTAEEKAAQKEMTYQYTLAFMRSVILGAK